MEQKIKDLLVKAGCNPELVTAIGESLVAYKSNIHEKYEADFTAKVEEAKKVCIEETEAHKRELARRLQIFLETKNATIEANLARQSALNESDATNKLKNLKAVLEGIEPNVQANNGQVTAVTENAKLKIRQLTEERDQAVAVANRQNAISQKVLKRNRELIGENTKLKTLQGNEGGSRPVNEGRNAPRQPARIDGTRRGAPATTTRSTLVENQTRRPAPTNNQTIRDQGSKGGFGVTDIASTMEEDLV